MGQRKGFSKMDIDKLNKMYKCKTTTSSSGYKPTISTTPQLISGGIEDILNMIIPTNDKSKRHTSKQSIDENSL